MIKTIEQACRFHPAIQDHQDHRMGRGIGTLADVIDAAGRKNLQSGAWA